MNRLIAVAAALVLVGCSRGDAPGASSSASIAARSAGAKAAAAAALSGTIEGKGAATTRTASFARLPDRGELLAYRDTGGGTADGAYTWHRADVSEDYALRAIADGHMRLRTPSGQDLDIVYDHHVEHDNGDLSWVGHLAGHQGAQTVLTFGAHAVYGVIGQADKRSLRLTTRDRAAWIVETDPDKLGSLRSAGANPAKPDYLAARKSPFAKDEQPLVPQEMLESIAARTEGATATAANTTVDVLIGYTQGFASAQGGSSAAATRLNQMVTVGNEALANSQASVRIRLVHSMQVNYADNTENDDTLEKLTGYDSDDNKYTTPDPAFSSLRAARETYGADLVALVRQFRDPEQDGCGIAWLIGGGRAPPTKGDGSDYFGYAVVSDGQDRNEEDNQTYFCREETLIHELGHNIGSQHDRDTARGSNGKMDSDEYGAYTYSFGYKTAASAGNFYTVMAYGDSGQIDYRVFSNPRITFCGGRACGSTTYEDNARSLGQVAPVIAGFRAAKNVPLLNLYAVKKKGAAFTEVHGLSAESNFKSFMLHIATPLEKSGSDDAWTYAFADYNGDGRLDLYAIKKVSSKVEVHILSGVGNFKTFLLRTKTVMASAGSTPAWEFAVGDYNQDGKPDIYGVRKNAASGSTEVHVLNGATKFQSYLLQTRSALGAVGASHSWEFALADYDRDGKLDLFGLKKAGASKMELHILKGSAKFGSFALRTTIPFSSRPAGDNGADFVVGDYNGDGVPDVYVIKKDDPTATEVHVLSGSSRYQSFLLRVETGLPPTGSDSSWEFGLVPKY